MHSRTSPYHLVTVRSVFETDLLPRLVRNPGQWHLALRYSLARRRHCLSLIPGGLPSGAERILVCGGGAAARGDAQGALAGFPVPSSSSASARRRIVSFRGHFASPVSRLIWRTLRPDRPRGRPGSCPASVEARGANGRTVGWLAHASTFAG
jgi:hypothetical protein